MSKKTKILLVDNDVDFIDLNKAVLENSGFDVVVAYSSAEGLDRVRFEQPDLIVLDLMMEKHDSGFGFAKAMKADPTTKNIPILMLTAVGSETGMEFSQELDGYWMKTDDYANKPLLPEDLVKKINELLAKSAKE
ncbi:MAG TPA: response regulator [Syntrophorhabdus sp.]|jgi:two-component system alkaline phosphatase synthesis response regulator PhoP|nr:response regulator [Syntrophorhabdus sp.]MDI9557160.1 response regulator [Pseudomonadota bacterium]OPX95767.1 MAG: Alkaline phosphatase synthesis transcriptional regulatory protein PhoP [Syntrophorhabdus sp. PtaB.Bin027]OQB78458.1 MAG: Alkaline phosphatase synthesis transcriptional regulatory protein PhoP [Deltaproteobacteria bacterium ADurb.Bin135]MBP8743896.1 response regulator [Syntrophorhabdus sp.]